jgi:RNA polymerase sigma-70 factor (sigma-E family)
MTTTMTLMEAPPSPALSGVEGLFRSEYRRLVGIARLLVDNPAEAEEVVQDAFIALHRNWDRLRDAGAAATWLRRAVVNGSRGRIRRRQVARRHLKVAEPDLRDGTDDRIVARAEHDQVATALRTLPDKQRACIALRYYADLSEAEIADALGISTGSVKTHTHRAMAALTVALEELR